LAVGMLTVLTFAMRRQAYLAAGIVFTFVEMVAVTLQMPLSMQLVGPHLSEDVLARAAHAFQSITDWHTLRPPIG